VNGDLGGGDGALRADGRTLRYVDRGASKRGIAMPSFVAALLGWVVAILGAVVVRMAAELAADAAEDPGSFAVGLQAWGVASIAGMFWRAAYVAGEVGLVALALATWRAVRRPPPPERVWSWLLYAHAVALWLLLAAAALALVD
jgi:hypothetical protein